MQYWFGLTIGVLMNELIQGFAYAMSYAWYYPFHAVVIFSLAFACGYFTDLLKDTYKGPTVVKPNKLPPPPPPLCMVIVFLLTFSFGAPCIAVAQTRITANDPIVDCVVHVRAQNADNLTQWGSGAWIDANHVLTALHVVTGSHSQAIVSRGRTWPADVESVDHVSDWAILVVTGQCSHDRFPEVRDGPAVYNEQLVAYGWGPVESDGKRNLEQIKGRSRVNAICGPLPRSGDSGGPIYDSAGRLVGVINSRCEQMVETENGRHEKRWYGLGLGRDLRSFCERRDGFFRRGR